LIELPPISIIGLGNVGWNLAKKLSEKGVQITRIKAESNDENQNFAESINSKICSNYGDFTKDELVLVCVRDIQVSTIMHELGPQTLWNVHTSGSVPIGLNLQQNSGVFYPFQTFKKHYAAQWEGVPIFIETKDKALENILYTLGSKIGAKPMPLDSSKRKQIHLAGVIGSNFTNHLLHLIDKEVTSENLPFDLIKPLVFETMRKAFDLGPANAQTGPAVRGDDQTIKDHLDYLESSKELQELYKHLSSSIQVLHS
jgi:predicted short-subunit dehydrogenase-like oxidoreductase (DUF2520 family)